MPRSSLQSISTLAFFFSLDESTSSSENEDRIENWRLMGHFANTMYGNQGPKITKMVDKGKAAWTCAYSRVLDELETHLTEKAVRWFAKHQSKEICKEDVGSS